GADGHRRQPRGPQRPADISVRRRDQSCVRLRPCTWAPPGRSEGLIVPSATLDKRALNLLAALLTAKCGNDKDVQTVGGPSPGARTRTGVAPSFGVCRRLTGRGCDRLDRR